MTAIPHHHAHDDHAHGHGNHAHGHVELGFMKKYLFSIDHKTIGLQFLFVGLMFFVVGGALAMLVRWQLGWPGADVPILSKLMGWKGGMPSEFYTMAFSMHATIMIFFVIIVLLVGTFGNYLIPLKIGAGDMAFPFLNGLAFWSALPAGTIMVTGFFLAGGAAAAGWTSYPPLSTIPMFKGMGPYAGNILRIDHSTWPMAPVLMNFIALLGMFGFLCAYQIRLGNKFLNVGVSLLLSAIGAIVMVRGIQRVCWDGQACWFLSLFWLGFSSLMGAVNYLTTIIKLRCPGMTMFRLPLSVWSLFITSLLVLLATPVLAATLMMNLLEHQMVVIGGTPYHFASFFTPYNWLNSNELQFNSGGAVQLRRRISDPAPAPLLVLFAPGRVHHDPAGDGHGLGHHRDVQPQADLRISPDGLRDRRYRVPRLHRVGAPHVPIRHERDARHDVRRQHDVYRRPVCDQNFQLDGHAVGRKHQVHDRHVERAGVRQHVRDRRTVGRVHGEHRR
jgi:hypothetical protein